MFNLLQTMEGYGDRIAMKSLNGEDSFEVSYKDYLKAIQYCAYNLQQELGDITGKHIGLVCKSNYEYTVMLAAIIYSRAVAVPINTFESDDNISYIIEDSDVIAVIVDEELEEKVLVDIKKVYQKDIISKKEKAIELKDFTEEEIDNPIFIIYTSGTTSRSKGAVLTVGNHFARKKCIINSDLDLNEDSLLGMKVYNAFPLYHVGGITLWISRLEYGCYTLLSHDIRNVLSDLEGEQIDVGSVTPAILKLWKKAIKRGNLKRLGGLKMVITGGAKIERELIDIYREKGIAFGQFYGLTEVSGNASSNYNMDKHLEAAGKPIDGVEIFTVDGEICIKGWSVMAGYYNKPEETAECIKDGVFYTGDLGYVDEEGYVYITGRKKNLIILSSGENVSPEELEKLVYGCEHVKECKAYEKDDRIVMGVFADESRQEDIRNYVAELNKSLPIYKHIHKVEFQDTEFEKTASGKIKR